MKSLGAEPILQNKDVCGDAGLLEDIDCETQYDFEKVAKGMDQTLELDKQYIKELAKRFLK